MDWPSTIWTWFMALDTGTQAGVAGAVFAALGVFGGIYTYFARRDPPLVPVVTVPVTIQHGPSNPRDRLGNAPPRPTLLEGRDDDIKALKARLDIDETQGGPRPTQPITVVRGWPGVGKTALVSELAYDAAISTAYPDGVLWAALGESPSLAGILASWGQSLGVDLGLTDVSPARAGEKEDPVTAASNRLRAFLHDKRMLLIVDDVWDVDHAKPLQVGGVSCATVFTTRERDLALELAGNADDVYLLDILSNENALALLRQLAPSVVENYPSEARLLVEDLEGLPLSIQVAGRLLNKEATRGDKPAQTALSVTKLFGELKDDLALLRARPPADRAEEALGVIVAKSTDRLDETVRDRFAYLSPFAPKPAAFELEDMAEVWDVDPEEAKKTKDALQDRGLLEPFGEGRFWIHALLVTHARSLLEVDEHGDRLAE